ncbi:DUF2973 domain-containing protein [Prochlorococcus marinus]|uniref:DUF2973 domain-containing protein n=1 Tax=Prochlorococcus marinus (strain MIT 9211) TaxID=93059 RepID=A9B9H8_PROM4|nr:DUF2973 domain-containing protein [Prochlorococcus marinus]ABX08033.1 conserved hypothetical protein [Prochlorococcus marinus str. MIT 9211]
MQSYFFSSLYLLAVIFLLWKAFGVMFKGFSAADGFSSMQDKATEDRTGKLTIHPELLNKEGRITKEDLLTVRFSKDLDPPNSSDRSTE